MDYDKRLETLSRLREAVEEAKALYENAKQEFEHATKIHRDLGATHPDGSLSLRNATNVYNHTLRNYQIALFRFNRYVLDGLDGKLPDEENPEDPATQI